MPQSVIYARKSTESEDRQVLSIPAQLSELRELAERLGVGVDRVLEESRSAREPGRPIFAELLRDVERGRVGTIFCWRLDRLARNPVDGGVIIHHLGHGRIRSVVTPEGTYGGNGNDKLILAVQFGMATKFIDDLSANVRRGHRAVLQSGRVPNRPPLGYLKERDPQAQPGRVAGSAVPDPERFELVSKLWRLLLTGGYTLREIYDLATREMGLTTRHTRRGGGGPVSFTSLYKLFSRPFYAGVLRHGGEVYRGNHVPMVTWEEYERVQQILGRSDTRRPQHRELTYSGFLRCGSCGRSFVGEVHTNRYGTRYVHYRCTRKKRSDVVCPEPYVSERTIDAEVEKALARITLPKPILDWTLKHLDAWAADERRTALARTESLGKAIAQVEAELERLRLLCVRGVITEGEYVRDREQRQGLLVDLERQLREPASITARWHEASRRVYELSAAALDAYRAGSVRTRRELLGQLASNLTVSHRKVALQLHKPFDLFVAEPSFVNSTVATGSNPSGDVTESLRRDQKRTREGSVPPDDFTQCTKVHEVRTFFLNQFLRDGSLAASSDSSDQVGHP